MNKAPLTVGHTTVFIEPTFSCTFGGLLPDMAVFNSVTIHARYEIRTS